MIFNDGCFEDVANKAVRDDKTIDLRPGQPMVFGKEGDKGLAIRGFDAEVVAAGEADTWSTDVVSSGPAFVLSQLDSDPSKPRPIGIFRDISTDTYEVNVNTQVEKAVATKGRGKLEDLVYAGDTWTV